MVMSVKIASHSKQVPTEGWLGFYFWKMFHLSAERLLHFYLIAIVGTDWPRWCKVLITSRYSYSGWFFPAVLHSWQRLLPSSQMDRMLLPVALTCSVQVFLWRKSTLCCLHLPVSAIDGLVDLLPQLCFNLWENLILKLGSNKTEVKNDRGLSSRFFSLRAGWHWVLGVECFQAVLIELWLAVWQS